MNTPQPSPVSVLNLPKLLGAGDIAPDCILPGPDGKNVNLRSDSIAGNPIVMMFCPRLTEAGKEMLKHFSHHLDTFTANGARLFAITLDRIADAQVQELRFPVLSDRQEQAFRNFTAPRDRPSTVVLRRNHHVAGILDGEPQAQLSAARALVESMAWERKASLMHMHPPVLLIPEALSRDDCAKLIDIFHTRGQTFLHPNQPAMD